MAGYVRTIAPTAEPLTKEEAKLWCRIDTNDDDATIANDLIPAAREWCENFTERSFITQTWKRTLDAFPSSEEKIELEYPPLLTITSLTYTDTAQASQTLTEGTHFVKGVNAHLGYIRPVYSTYWPTSLSVPDSVTIIYTAGYGATGDSVPKSIKQAIALLVSHWYDNRGLMGSVTGKVYDAAVALLLPYRVFPT